MKYAVFQTSAGWMGVRASDNGLTDVILPRQSREDVLTVLHIMDEVGTDYFTDLIRRFRAYFDGEAVDFPDEVDVSSGTPFQRGVWEVCRRIPRGVTRSYSELAAETGRSEAARATGSALAKNPLPIIIPCHRVIAANGTLGGFSGGLEMKRHMLELEGAFPVEHGG
jgi:methylated-DNA-[protein]-cysteine S-methyltransferase